MTSMPGPLPDRLYEQIGELLDHPALRANPELGLRIAGLARAAWDAATGVPGAGPVTAAGSDAAAILASHLRGILREAGLRSKPAGGPGGRGAFRVTAGADGCTVTWVNDPPGREFALTQISGVLTRAGLAPQLRDTDIYVPVPAEPGTGLPGEPARGFYRNTIRVTILSRGPWHPADLDDLSKVRYAIGEGDCCGDVATLVLNQPLTAAQVADQLAAFGADEMFLLPAEDDPQVCGCPQPARDARFPVRCAACGDRLPGTVAECDRCGQLIVLDAAGQWTVPGEEPAPCETTGREHGPVPVLSAGHGEDGTCNCQNPAVNGLADTQCRNCGCPLNSRQAAELTLFTGPGPVTGSALDTVFDVLGASPQARGNITRVLGIRPSPGDGAAS